MKEFRKYQHIERFGTTEVENIELGKCYVFPKIDGANASAWLGDDEGIKGGSRNRQLHLDNDNAGFLKWLFDQNNIIKFLNKNPKLRLFGEWLVPHSLKTYKENAWRQFYVFDVATDKPESDIKHEGDDKLKYMPYDTYKPLLDEFGLNYIPPIAIIENSNKEQLIKQLQKNVFLIEDGKGVGEGIVIKNYDYYNKHGRQTWAKIVTSEFKEKHSKVMGAPEMKGNKIIEKEIAEKYVTKSLCEKVKANIENETQGFSSKQIPRLLNTVYYDLIKEETWNFIKYHKRPVIDFGRLQHFTFVQVKSYDLF